MKFRSFRTFELYHTCLNIVSNSVMHGGRTVGEYQHGIKTSMDSLNDVYFTTCLRIWPNLSHKIGSPDFSNPIQHRRLFRYFRSRLHFRVALSFQASATSLQNGLQIYIGQTYGANDVPVVTKAFPTPSNQPQN